MVVRRRVGIMRLAVVMVAMPPQDQFFQHEENHDAKQNGSRHAMRIAMFQCMRQDFQKGRAEQGTDRVGDQDIDVSHAKGQTQARRRDNAQGATGQ